MAMSPCFKVSIRNLASIVIEVAVGEHSCSSGTVAISGMEACNTAALLLFFFFYLLEMVLRAGMGVLISPGTDPCIGSTMVAEPT